jgi:sortase (surface protein transpeptidase)
MTKLIVKIVNSETGEEIEREMNAQELAQNNLDFQAFETKQIEIAEVKAKKAALLARLDITDDEAKLLLS